MVPIWLKNLHLKFELIWASKSPKTSSQTNKIMLFGIHRLVKITHSQIIGARPMKNHLQPLEKSKYTKITLNWVDTIKRCYVPMLKRVPKCSQPPIDWPWVAKCWQMVLNDDWLKGLGGLQN